MRIVWNFNWFDINYRPLWLFGKKTRFCPINTWDMRRMKSAILLEIGYGQPHLTLKFHWPSAIWWRDKIHQTPSQVINWSFITWGILGVKPQIGVKMSFLNGINSFFYHDKENSASFKPPNFNFHGIVFVFFIFFPPKITSKICMHS
jgi:hypothetical protein